MLRDQLRGPSKRVEVPIHAIHFTQRSASDTFAHGPHAGRLVKDLVEDLVSGRVRTTEDSMVLDVVLWHGDYWSANNRHLKALKLYLHRITPEWRREAEVAATRVWPLNPRLRMTGGWTPMEKLTNTLDPGSSGERLSLRHSRSPSRRAHSLRRAG
mmetsp:Transcript_124772/g.388409  ORF Transcript_124772/g.388409 Transcript_124772/m.388409 type:complete len:156 (-) Transcript_124772:73-540(-)